MKEAAEEGKVCLEVESVKDRSLETYGYVEYTLHMKCLLLHIPFFLLFTAKVTGRAREGELEHVALWFCLSCIDILSTEH